MTQLTIFTALLYLVASMTKSVPAAKNGLLAKVIVVLGLSALLLHTVLLYHWIDTSLGQNLTLLNVLSLLSWLMCLLVWLMSLTRPIANLLQITMPLAALSIVCVSLFPGVYLIRTGDNTMYLLHILLSILAFSILVVSGLQALVTIVQHHRLQTAHPSGFGTLLPPIETMEKLLFQMIFIGFICLTISMIIGFVELAMDSIPSLVQKIGFSMLAWLVFALLLYGRCYYGWRGRTACYGTLSGVSLLMLAYLGSRIFAN